MLTQFMTLLTRIRKFFHLHATELRHLTRGDYLGCESLEPRLQLSGNVSVIQTNHSIHLVGDNESNAIELILEGNDVLLRGNDDTTINGSTDDLTLRTNSSQIDASLYVRLFDGDDQLVIRGQMEVTGNVIVLAGRGNDSIGVDQVDVGGMVLIAGQSGDDQIAVQSTTVAKNLIVDLDAGDDTLSTQNLTVGGQLFIFGGNGAEAIELDTTNVAGRLFAKLGRGDDTISIKDGAIQRDLIIKSGGQSDFLSLDNTTIARNSKFILSGGDDQIVINGQSSIGGRLIEIGGGGRDAAQVPASVLNRPAINVSIEGSSVSTNEISQRIDAPTVGLNDRIARAQQILGSPTTPDPLPLFVSTAQNNTVQSQGTLITKDASFLIEGSTEPGAVVKVDRDGNQAFDDGTAVADANGNFSITVTLIHNATNLGDNPMQVQATLGDRTATQKVRVHLAVGTVTRMASSLGFVDLELLDTDAPNTVANFKDYFSRYTDSIVHRKATTTTAGVNVIQGGGFVLNGLSPTPITTDPPIANEFNPANPNVRGSIAMARFGGDVNSATSQWFINTTNNSGLNTQQFTVFGHVIGDGMSIVDAMFGLPAFDLAALTGQNALTDVPLQGYTAFSDRIAGSLSTVQGSTTVVGVGTSFVTDIPADRRIRVAGQVLTIASVDSDTQLTLNAAAPATLNSVPADVNALPIATQYVTYQNVRELTELN